MVVLHNYLDFHNPEIFYYRNLDRLNEKYQLHLLLYHL